MLKTIFLTTLSSLLFIISPASFSKEDPATIAFNKKEAINASKYNVINDLPIWEKTATELQSSFDTIIKRANDRLDAIAKIKKHKITFKNTVKALDDIYYQVDLLANRASVLAAASLDKSIREKGAKIETAISNWYVDVSSRQDIYKQVQILASKPAKKLAHLSKVEHKLLEETLRDYKRVGFHLSLKDQEIVKTLKKELSELESKVDENIKKAGSDKIVFSSDEMKGMPADELSALEKDGDNYIAQAGVTYQVYAVLSNSPIEEVRKKAHTQRNQRAMAENKELTTQIILKRAKLAKLLGYNTWADYKTEVKMAGSGKIALEFVDSLIEGLEPKFQAEMESLRELKVLETSNSHAKIESWDVRYYQQVLEKKLYNLDMSSLKKYFSYDSTLKGMFKIFERIFKLKIEFVDAPYKWAEELKLVRITDLETLKPMGFLYLDMFPRPNEDKYGHFAMFTIRSGKLLRNGQYRRPVAALICNFPKPTPGKPSLLDFDQVETLFHEFGHALHGILTESQFAQFAGTRVARDFVEAPSQMLENWVHSKKVLDQFAVNYNDASDKFPEDALNKIKKASLATVATFYRRQLAFGKMDLMLHQNISTDTNFDINEYTNQVLSDVYYAFPENTAMITSFGHLWGGYDAGYYGYAWADNLAADMASKFETAKDGFLDVEMGMKLRKQIYEVGSTKDLTFSIESFLERESNNQAFLKKLGIGI